MFIIFLKNLTSPELNYHFNTYSWGFDINCSLFSSTENQCLLQVNHVNSKKQNKSTAATRTHTKFMCLILETEQVHSIHVGYLENKTKTQIYIERDTGSTNQGKKRDRERIQASICREGVRRHAFWQELKKTAVFGVVFLNASMLLQSLRLA